jgi:adenosyl cobinamide kinase/adenosyl cobinamide phosphate guanylyltransferase
MITVIELVVGIKNSGKSFFAEERALAVASTSQPLYVATLPPIARFSERIRTHRLRRADRWHLLELSDSFNEILVASGSLAKPRVVLLDGLGAFLARSLLAASNVGLEIRKEAASIQRLYSDFLVEALDTVDLLIVVSTLVCGASPQTGMTDIDKVSAVLNNALCACTACAARIVWHAQAGHVGEKRWREIVACYGLTTT